MSLDGATTREGFAVLWVAIKREQGIFALSTIGSVLFGALTVADAWVLGWATDHVVCRRSATGEIGTGLLVCGASRSSSASPSCGRSASSPAGSAPASCSTA